MSFDERNSIESYLVPHSSSYLLDELREYVVQTIEVQMNVRSG